MACQLAVTGLGALKQRAQTLPAVSRKQVHTISDGVRLKCPLGSISASSSTRNDDTSDWRTTTDRLLAEVEQLIRQIVADMWLSSSIVKFVLALAGATAAAPLDQLSGEQMEKILQVIALATLLSNMLQTRASECSVKASWLLVKAGKHIDELVNVHLPNLQKEMDVVTSQSRNYESSAAANARGAGVSSIGAIAVTALAAAACKGIPRLKETVDGIIYVRGLSITNGKLTGTPLRSDEVPKRSACSSLLLDWLPGGTVVGAVICVGATAWQIWRLTRSKKEGRTADTRNKQLGMLHNQQSRSMKCLNSQYVQALKVMHQTLVNLTTNPDAVISTQLGHLVADLRQVVIARARLLTDPTHNTDPVYQKLVAELAATHSALMDVETRWSTSMMGTVAGLTDALGLDTQVLLSDFLASSCKHGLDRLGISVEQAQQLLEMVQLSSSAPDKLLEYLARPTQPSLAASQASAPSVTSEVSAADSI